MHKYNLLSNMKRRAFMGVLGGSAAVAALTAVSGGGAARAAEVAGETKDAFAVIHSRRSYRNFTGEKVEPEDVKRILAAAMSAPSAHNSQPWAFVVLDQPERFKDLVQVLPRTGFLTSAGVIIVPCFELSAGVTREEAMISTSCAGENLLLAVEALGYGAVWLGIQPDAEKIQALSKLLKLPDSLAPLCVVPIGHPLHRIGPEDRFDEKKVHYNTW